MTFYVQKSLAMGPIRFGVSPRDAAEAIDADTSLSTGAAGEFVRKRARGFYFADETPVGAPKIPTAPTISSTSFWKSLRGEGMRGIGFLALMIVGAIMVLLGIAVVMRKGAAGWVEIILGLIMIAVPIVLTAQQRKAVREREEKERAEREAREARHRELLANYVGALDRMRTAPDDAAFEQVAREREALDLPYELWAPIASRTVLRIGFDALAKLGSAGARQVARLMDRASAAAGLRAQEDVATKYDLYRTVVWHLLADDRLGGGQEEELLNLRKGFDIWDRDMPLEVKSIDEFRRLRGIHGKSLPRITCPIPLTFQEHCIHQSPAVLIDKKRETAGTLFITNKRLLLDAGKRNELALPSLDDIVLDADRDVLTIKAEKTTLALRLADPIYTASVLDIAASTVERPRWQ